MRPLGQYSDDACSPPRACRYPTASRRQPIVPSTAVCSERSSRGRRTTTPLTRIAPAWQSIEWPLAHGGEGQHGGVRVPVGLAVFKTVAWAPARSWVGSTPIRLCHEFHYVPPTLRPSRHEDCWRVAAKEAPRHEDHEHRDQRPTHQGTSAARDPD